MTKKIYVDVFVSLLLHISEGTYHRQFVKFARFSMFRHIFGKYLEPRKEFTRFE